MIQSSYHMLNNVMTLNDLTLRPLSDGHREKLRLFAQDDRIWTFNTLINKYSTDLYNSWFAQMMNNALIGSEIPFILEYKEQSIGTTRYYSIKTEKKELAVGFTWIHPTYWGQGINKKMKVMILENAFHHGFEKVFFHVDHLNIRSQNALKGIGAIVHKTYDHHRMRPDGSYRDTIEFLVNKEIFLNFKSAFSA